jgi:FAD/FMN-containing dehydrogenase
VDDRQQLAEFVGKENFFDDPEILEDYSGDESFVHKIRPRCVVKPNSMEQVQDIVKWANDTLTPLVPVSSGTPRFRGDTVPNVGGSVIVDLSGMKKIIRVDRRNRVVMVEPGVTYEELILEVEKHGMVPFMPLAPRANKSVVTSALEREPLNTPRHHWDPQDPLRCVEIIYGSGDLFRTGSAAGPGTLEEQWEVGRAQVRGIGPAHTDFSRIIQGAQGTLGIVTWASLGCRILPEKRKTFLISAERLEDLTELTHKLLWRKLGDEVLILNSTNFAALFTNGTENMKEMMDALPSWILIFSIAGEGLLPDERIAYQEADFRETVQAFGMTPLTVLQGIKGDNIAELLSKPSGEPFWKIRSKGGSHDLFFLTMLYKTPDFIKMANEVAGSHRYPMGDIGVYIQPTMQGANAHCEFNLFYSPENLSEVDKVKTIDRILSKQITNSGGFFSRPYGSWKETAYGGGADIIAASRKVKDIFDPKGVMNPGKLCFT